VYYAITTKYIGSTPHRASRVKATEPEGRSVTLPWDHELQASANHKAAAIALATKLKWWGELVTGTNSGSFSHVFSSRYYGGTKEVNYLCDM